MELDEPPLASVMPDEKVPLRGVESDNFFQSVLLSANSSGNMKVLVASEDCVHPGLDGILYVDEVLNKDCCNQLMFAIDSCAQLSFWSASGRENQDAKRFRNADTIEVHSKSFASLIWQRLSQNFGTWEINIGANEDEDPRWERELPGVWRATGVNEDMLFAVYPSGGNFAPHTDGRAVKDFNCRSFFSIILYLNSIPINEGGGTRFYHSDSLKSLHLDGLNQWTCDLSQVSYTIEAKAGRCLIFSQEMVHEGIPPDYPNCKYILRSDIMFSRTPAICSSDSDRKAYSNYLKGQNLAEKGLLSEALPLMKKAMKESSFELQAFL